MFLWAPKGCISLSRSFPDFFLICIFHHGSGKVSYLWLKLLVNTFVIQKIESVIFTHSHQENSPTSFYHYPQAEGNYPLLPNSFF